MNDDDLRNSIGDQLDALPEEEREPAFERYKRRMLLHAMTEHYDELNASRLREIDAGTRHPGNATQIFADHIWISQMLPKWYPEEDGEAH